MESVRYYFYNSTRTTSPHREAVLTTPFCPQASNKIILIPAPETTHRFAGVSAVAFVFWFVALSCGVFGYLFFYFHSNNCSINSVVVANLEDKSRYDLYNSGTNYLCNARMPLVGTSISFHRSSFSSTGANVLSDVTVLSDVYCQLGNIPCESHGKFRSDLCSSTRCGVTKGVYNDQTLVSTSEIVYNCMDAMMPNPTGFYGFQGRNPTNILAVEYVSCEAVSTSLMNALQYTMLAQLIGTMLFLFLLKTCAKGLSALREASTYFNVLENRVVHREETVYDGSGGDIEIAELPQKEPID